MPSNWREPENSIIRDYQQGVDEVLRIIRRFGGGVVADETPVDELREYAITLVHKECLRRDRLRTAPEEEGGAE